MKLMKEKARAPIIPNGVGVGNVGWDDNQTAYRIDLYPADPGERNYSVSLTRGEMFQVVATWLEKESRDETDRVKKARAVARTA